MKKISLFLSMILSLFTPAIFLMSCYDSGYAKKNKQWGGANFIRKYDNLTYKDEVDNVELINDVDYSLTGSNTTYQMLVYAFADGNNDGIGDFIGAKEKLDYLVSLGIDQIWLSPVHPASSYHGYDVIDYTMIAPEFGGMVAFDAFLRSAHEKGIKIYLDMIFNHTSYEHPWFQEAIKNPDSKYRNFYRFNDNNNDYGDLRLISKDYANKFVNLNSPQIPQSEYIAKFSDGMPDLNLGNQNVIEELKYIQNFWVKKGVDGFRYDAFIEFFSSKGETKNNFNVNRIIAESRKSINDEVTNRSDKFKPYLFGEWWEGPLEAREYYYDDDRPAFNSAYDGKHWHGNPFVTMSYSTMEEIAGKYSEKQDSIEQWMPFLGNHDQDRWINSYLTQFRNYNPSSFPKILDSRSVEALSTALFSLLTRPANPIIFQGDELGYHGRKSPNDAALREPIKWSSKKYMIDFWEAKSGKSERIYLKFSSDRPSADLQIVSKNEPAYLVSKLNKWRKDNQFLGETNKQTIEDATNVYERIEGKLANVFIRKNKESTKKFLIGFTLEGKAKIRLKNGFIKTILKSKNVSIDIDTISLERNSYFIIEI